MKAGWEVKALGEVCLIKPPKSLARKALSDSDEVSFVPMSDLGELEKSFMPKQAKLLCEVYGGYTYFGENDVLVAKITPCFENGKLGIGRGLRNSIGFGSSEFVAIRSSGAILPEFIFYYLFRDEFRETGAKIMTGAVGHKRVPDEYIRQLPIPLPPLEEQKRIVEVLDAAFEGLSRARAHTQANLENARELFDSGLESIVASAAARWPNVALSTLTATISDGDHAAPPKATDGVPFITISNVDKETLEINFFDTFKVPQGYYDALKENRKPRQGDVLYSVTGSFGIPVHVKENIAFCFQRHIGLVRPKPALDSRWLFFLLLSPHVYRQADEGASGTAQRTVSLTQLRSFSVPDVPLAEQIRFAASLDAQLSKSRELQSHYRAKLADLDALRQALLQKAFAGELT